MKKDWMIKESELDDAQVQVLQATLDKSCIVAGCAGSGKSVLALIKAQRIQRERGDSCIVIVYTKALCEYMSSGKEELGLNNAFYHHWYWKNRLGQPSADYIIVDEIQDFTKEEIREFVAATRKCFFFFGDTAQSIYDGFRDTVHVDRLPSFINRGDIRSFELYRNYRLPVPVARVVQEVGVDLQEFYEPAYKSRANEKPRFIKYDSTDEQLAAIHGIIERNNFTDVAILLPDNNYVEEVYSKLKQLGGNYEEKHTDKADWRQSRDSLNFNSTNPKIMTYHSAKGLQFEAVFLPYIERFRDRDRKALYVAMTRTYRYLYVMYSGSLPSPLSNIDSSLYVESEIDELDDL